MLIQNTLENKLRGNFIKSNNLMLTFLFLLIMLGFSAYTELYADMDPAYRKKLEVEDASRERRVDGYFDMQYNTVSNMQFTVHNDGRTFYDAKLRRLTGMWPRGSVNGYVFGGGIWVGSKKRFYLKTWDEEKQDSVNIVEWDTTRYFQRWDWENATVDASGKTTVPVINDSVYQARYTEDPNRNGKIVDVTYDPRTAESYMVPGRIEDGDAGISSDATSYRVYFSMDYNSSTGQPLVEESGPAWPIWDNLDSEDKVLKYDRYFGHYIKDIPARNVNTYPKGPAFISGEDIFTTYKDTDLPKMNGIGSVGKLSNLGYPLRIQYEQMIYSWGFGDYRDFIFIKYDQINHNQDTLWDMWLAPIFDIDIGLITDGGNGAYNDKTSFYGMEPNKNYPDLPDPERARHNMAYQYSESTRGEGGKGFGYVGFVFLESPAVIGETIDFNRHAEDQNPVFRYMSDSIGFVRKEGTWLRTDPATGLLDTCRQLLDGSWVCGDVEGAWYIEENPNNMRNVPWYPVEEQLGLTTFRQWTNDGNEPTEPEVFYNFITHEGGMGGWDGPTGSSNDMRYMMATGPFHMRPGDTSRTVVGLVFAATGKGGDATGDTVDLAELVRKTEFMQTVYDENFRAPQPPISGFITATKPLNNGMVIQWDSTSELSTDLYERGMAFMGYRIYRARRDNLDTFNLNDIAGNSIYTSGQGPFGWKELKNYSMPTPYVKSYISPAHLEGSGPSAQMFYGIDSLMPLGPYYVKNPETGAIEIDPRSIMCVRVPTGVSMYPLNLLWAAIEIEKQTPGENRLPMLANSGWYDDIAYGKRFTPVVSSIDSAVPAWGKFYYEHNDFNLNERALFGAADSFGVGRSDAPKSFLWDSVMLCRLELNPALARINPLFYKQIRVKITPEMVDSFTVKYDSNGYVDNYSGTVRKPNAHWVVRDSVNEATGNPVIDPNTKLQIRVPVVIDTLYDVSSIQSTHVPDETGAGGAGETFWTITCMILRDSATMAWLKTSKMSDWTEQNIYGHINQGKDWLLDTTHHNLVRDSIYNYIEMGWIKNIHSADFGDGGLYSIPFSTSDLAKNEVIIPYMREITNNRTFVDIGDDPPAMGYSPDAYILESDDPTRTERLLNNVEYFYKVVAFDEGDWLQPTPSKTNVGVNGLPNFVQTYPSSDAPAVPLKFDIIGTEGFLGGVFNSQLFSIDEERVAQLFAGDTMELEFYPLTAGTEVRVTHRWPGSIDSAISGVPAGVYRLGIRLTNVTKDILLYDAGSQLEITSCFPTAAMSWVDNAMARTSSDIVTEESSTFAYSDIGVANSKQSYDAINVHFTTGDFRTPEFCYSMAESNMMWGNIGFSFDIGLKQYGGVYRGDSVDMSGLNHEVTTMVVPLSATETSWTSDAWYTNELYRNGTNITNRQPMLGGQYGYKIADDIGFKEEYTSDFIGWFGRQVPPLNSGEYAVTSYGPGSIIFNNTRFDNGPGAYEITFKPGGRDTIRVLRGPNATTPTTFYMDYLEIDVNDTYSFKRYAPDQPGVDSVEIRYPSVIEPMELPVQSVAVVEFGTGRMWICKTPHPKNLGFNGGNPEDFYRKYNLYAAGYINTRAANAGEDAHKNNVAYDYDLTGGLGIDAEIQYIGNQNRYYLTGISADGKDTIDFVHTLNIAGAQWVLSYHRGGRRPDGNIYVADAYGVFTRRPIEDVYKDDFRADDKIKLLSWGGVSGMPEKGAKIRFAVSNPYVEYTDEMMDQITIVPNPYVITHQSQASPYGAEVYFTKLPAVCDIEIFTAAGDLVTSISHNETIDGTRRGVAIYDMLTKNGQRVQSQTLVALIKEPNGAMTTKHFSVIVGGFRVVE